MRVLLPRVVLVLLVSLYIRRRLLNLAAPVPAPSTRVLQVTPPMTHSRSTFHGDLLEKGALLDAMSHNCACKQGEDGSRTTTCPVHDALINDQRFLNGLLWMRHDAERLRREEHEDIPKPTEKLAPYRTYYRSPAQRTADGL